jgi:phage anti-repressor protein
MEIKKKELISITNMGDSEVVSARELYTYLGATERFESWFNRQLQFGFEENTDYVSLQIIHPQNQQEITDYALSMDMAKELSMLQKTEKGRAARSYFITCEKKLKEVYKEIEEGIKSGDYIKLSPSIKFRLMYALAVEETFSVAEMQEVLMKTDAMVKYSDIMWWMAQYGFWNAKKREITSHGKDYITYTRNLLTHEYELRFTKKGVLWFSKHFRDINFEIHDIPECGILEREIQDLKRWEDLTSKANSYDRFLDARNQYLLKHEISQEVEHKELIEKHTQK